MSKGYKLTAAHANVLKTQLGAGIGCGRAEKALNVLSERAHATGDQQFAKDNDALLLQMENEMRIAEQALAKYRGAATKLLMLHEAKQRLG